MKDYYTILQISSNASDVEIKKSFRASALRLHPDRNKDVDAHSRFVEVNEAYQILSDPIKRKKYDSFYNYYVVNSAGAKRPGKEDHVNFEEWAEKGQNVGRRYASSNFTDFVRDAYMDLGTNVLLEGIFDSLGNIIDTAADAIGDVLD